MQYISNTLNTSTQYIFFHCYIWPSWCFMIRNYICIVSVDKINALKLICWSIVETLKLKHLWGLSVSSLCDMNICLKRRSALFNLLLIELFACLLYGLVFKRRKVKYLSETDDMIIDSNCFFFQIHKWPLDLLWWQPNQQKQCGTVQSMKPLCLMQHTSDRN